MHKYNYIEIGNRIRSERKKMGVSQAELLDNIKDKGKPTCSRNILSQLENGDETAFNGISMEKMIALCEEFDCSLSYLLGEYSCKNYDNEFIHDKTGLTDDAIDVLFANKDKTKQLFILNELITQESILDLITKYFFLSKSKSTNVLEEFYFNTDNGTVLPGKDCVIGNIDSEIYCISENNIALTSDIIKSSLLNNIQESLILFTNKYDIARTDTGWKITYKTE